jgi:hypothetical protein
MIPSRLTSFVVLGLSEFGQLGVTATQLKYFPNSDCGSNKKIARES